MYRDISEKYEATRDGHVRNKKTQRILAEFAGKDGYLRTQFEGKTRTVHRVIAKAFLPIEEGKNVVNHKDGNKKNNSVENLEWCTESENLKHAYSCGLKSSVGEKNGRTKLNADDVQFIKENYKKGDKEYGAKALGKKFGVAHQTICAVVSGQNWH